MKKLNLHVDDLSVESFQVTSAPAARGTVGGNQYSNTTCHQDICTCPTTDTCPGGPSCDETCACSCDGTCSETATTTTITTTTDDPSRHRDIC